MRKKIFLVMITLLLTFSLFGCQKEKPLNYDRGTDYQYDFIDFIDVKLYGSEGNGFIEVKPKDIKLGDVVNGKTIPEKDMIAIMKLINELGCYVGPNEEVESRLSVTNNFNLKNDDVVAYFFNLDGFTTESTDLSMNLEPFYWKVEGLKEPTQLDLFDSQSVLFYGIEGTKDVYALKTGKGLIPEDVYNSLIYTATVTGEDNVIANKTIINATAKIDEGVLKGGNNPAFTEQTYFGRKGLVVEQNSEKILTKVVSQINVDSINKDQAENAIKTFLDNQTIMINDVIYSNPKVMTLQVKEDSVKSSRATSEYITTFRVSGSQGSLCLTLPLKMVNIDGTYLVPSANGSMQAITNDACGSVMNGNAMVVNYNPPIIEPTPEVKEENGENNLQENSENNPEENPEQIQENSETKVENGGE